MKDRTFKSCPFVPPVPPKYESDEIRAELERLSSDLEAYKATNRETEQKLFAVEQKFKEAKDEQAFWEQMAAETEQAKIELANRLAEQQDMAAAKKTSVAAYATAATRAAGSLQFADAETLH